MNVAEEHSVDHPSRVACPGRWRFTLRTFMMGLTVAMLLVGWVTTTLRLRNAESELAVLRRETGYLEPSGDGQIAAVRLVEDQPLSYRLRVRVPRSQPYRVAYSTRWPSGRHSPDWYSAIDLPPGESVLMVQIQPDPRDQLWKITTMVRSDDGTKRMATVLPPEQVSMFRQSHDVLSTGIGRQTTRVNLGEKIRLLDERWLVGEGGWLLYGSREPQEDIMGVFAEVQPDDGPL